MTVTPPGPGPLLAELAGLLAVSTASLELPAAGRAVDRVVLAPPPPVATLQDLATAGLQQLRSLLPVLERLVQGGLAEPTPLGLLARAIGDAAHAVGAGAEAVALNTAPALASHLARAWPEVARDALLQATDLLTSAGQNLHSPPQMSVPPPGFANPELLWAMSQLVGAQQQIGGALNTFARQPSAVLAIHARSAWPGGTAMPGALVLVGLVLTLALYAAAYGMRLVLAGCAAAGVGLLLALARRATLPHQRR